MTFLMLLITVVAGTLNNMIRFKQVSGVALAVIDQLQFIALTPYLGYWTRDFKWYTGFSDFFSPALFDFGWPPTNTTESTAAGWIVEGKTTTGAVIDAHRLPSHSCQVSEQTHRWFLAMFATTPLLVVVISLYRRIVIGIVSTRRNWNAKRRAAAEGSGTIELELMDPDFVLFPRPEIITFRCFFLPLCVCCGLEIASDCIGFRVAGWLVLLGGPAFVAIIIAVFMHWAIRIRCILVYEAANNVEVIAKMGHWGESMLESGKLNRVLSRFTPCLLDFTKTGFWYFSFDLLKKVAIGICLGMGTLKTQLPAIMTVLCIDCAVLILRRPFLRPWRTLTEIVVSLQRCIVVAVLLARDGGLVSNRSASAGIIILMVTLLMILTFALIISIFNIMLRTLGHCRAAIIEYNEEAEEIEKRKEEGITGTAPMTVQIARYESDDEDGELGTGARKYSTAAGGRKSSLAMHRKSSLAMHRKSSLARKSSMAMGGRSSSGVVGKLSQSISGTHQDAAVLSAENMAAALKAASMSATSSKIDRRSSVMRRGSTPAVSQNRRVSVMKQGSSQGNTSPSVLLNKGSTPADIPSLRTPATIAVSTPTKAPDPMGTVGRSNSPSCSPRQSPRASSQSRNSAPIVAGNTSRGSSRRPTIQQNVPLNMSSAPPKAPPTRKRNSSVLM